jgi:hypothetical protein
VSRNGFIPARRHTQHPPLMSVMTADDHGHTVV